ncbi:helix-turn-helix domain-containing protein [Alicyclobacillus sendaiensis]|uniref:helix-turn-helix domain-containing protein n=1 Tax=Alicyclobacillus sendaiensis TaxID=192387 RepID=UPI0026F44AA6|nr:helix-turn-helix transcriptional regulator [Alicyclobacillus sendaiensis]
MIRCNLAVLLAERGLKIADVWRKTGISRTTLHSLYHNTSTGIQWDTLDRLCSLLRVEPGDLLLYSPFEFQIEAEDWDDKLVSLKVKYGARGATRIGTVDVLLDYQDNDTRKVILHIVYPDDLYNQLKSLQPVFSQHVEHEVIYNALRYLSIEDVDDIETVLTTKEDNDE